MFLNWIVLGSKAEHNRTGENACTKLAWISFCGIPNQSTTERTNCACPKIAWMSLISKASPERPQSISGHSQSAPERTRTRALILWRRAYDTSRTRTRTRNSELDFPVGITPQTTNTNFDRACHMWCGTCEKWALCFKMSCVFLLFVDFLFYGLLYVFRCWISSQINVMQKLSLLGTSGPPVLCSTIYFEYVHENKYDAYIIYTISMVQLGISIFSKENVKNTYFFMGKS